MLLEFAFKIESLNTIKKPWKYAIYRKRIEQILPGIIFNSGGVRHFEKAKVVYTRFAPRPIQDFDNLVGGWKPVQDTLVKANFFPDDSTEHIQVEYRQEKSEEYKVRIKILGMDE